MKAIASRSVLLAGLALTLGLAACKKAEDGAAPTSGGPVAAVAPPAGKAWTDIVSATPDGGMRMGNPAAPIKLVEYGSLSCPHCAKFSADSTKALMEKYVGTGKVSYEFRSFAIHPQDVPLTVLVRCAPAEAFFPMVEQVYANFEPLTASTMKGAPALQKVGNLPPERRFIAIADALGFTEFFAARGIATDQAHACLADAKAAQRVAAESQKAGDAGIDSTPTILVNGTKVTGNTWADVEPVLQRSGAR
ncbi:MAG: thioredoxin domain-containing protein [Sphingomonadales bacterium]|nr:thioredoxin domain-containing protein [Sphingomonadales bacterium]